MKRTLIKKLDTAWSKRIKQSGVCEVCGKNKPLNAHHFYSRSIRVVRWDIDNGFCLCVQTSHTPDCLILFDQAVSNFLIRVLFIKKEHPHYWAFLH